MNIEGVVPILPTPFDEDGALDLAPIPGLVEFAIRSRAAAVGTPAFGSEFYKLDGAERVRVIDAVLAAANGRMPVIVQCNHHHPGTAAQLAADAEKRGAAMINTALPRAFAASDGQLLDYARRVCGSVSIPVVVQDWNPAGRAVGLGFVVELRQSCPNFRYFKYEEPGLGDRVRAIRRETGEQVGVFSGWGGSYLLEQIPAGICGIMPGLAFADLLAVVWNAARSGDWMRAFGLFAAVSPYLQFSLQTFEQFHHAEKRALVRRGALPRASVRPVTVELNGDARACLDRMLDFLEQTFAGSSGLVWSKPSCAG